MPSFTRASEPPLPGEFFGGVSGAEFVQLGDLDGDSKIDAIVAKQSGSQDIVIFPGLGDATFGAPVVIGNGTGSLGSLELVDVDHDSKLDLVSTSGPNGMIQTRLGDGVGGFSPPINSLIGILFTAAATGRIDQDHHLDVVMLSGATATLRVCRGDGHGGFVVTSVIPVGSVLFSLAVGDLNGDHRDDVLGVGPDSTSLVILFNDGFGGFGSSVSIQLNAPIYMVSIADLDLDRDFDILVTLLNDPGILALIGDGHGGFSSQTSGGPTISGFHRVLDLNSDQFPDLALLGFHQSEIWMGAGNGTFTHFDYFRAGSECRDFEIADIDGDGYPDLVASGGYSEKGIFVHRGTRFGGFDHLREYATGGGSVDLVVVDVDGDQASDIVTADIEGWGNTVFFGLGNGDFDPSLSLPGGKFTGAVAVGDLNGDGMIDIFSGSGGLLSQSELLYGHFAAGQRRFNATRFDFGMDVSAATTGDVNNDGVADLVALGDSFALGTVMYGTASGSPYPLTTFPSTWHNIRIELSDLNGDQRLDVVSASDHSSGSLSIHLANASGFPGPTQLATGGRPTDLALADLNGDQRQDLVFSRQTSTSNKDHSVVRLGDGNGGFLQATDYPSGVRPSGVAIGDLNGDGLADFAVSNRLSDTVTLYFGDGGGGFGKERKFYFGYRPYAIALGDFNGDSKLDLVGAHTETDSIAVLLQR